MSSSVKTLDLYYYIFKKKKKKTKHRTQLTLYIVNSQALSWDLERSMFNLAVNHPLSQIWLTEGPV